MLRAVIRDLFAALLALFVFLMFGEALEPGFATNFLHMPAYAVILIAIGTATAFYPPKG